jgi:hypothetical protein
VKRERERIEVERFLILSFPVRVKKGQQGHAPYLPTMVSKNASSSSSLFSLHFKVHKRPTGLMIRVLVVMLPF